MPYKSNHERTKYETSTSLQSAMEGIQAVKDRMETVKAMDVTTQKTKVLKLTDKPLKPTPPHIDDIHDEALWSSSSSRIDDPQNEFLAEQVNTVMTKVVHKLEAVLQSQNVMQPPRETVMEEFHRGKMTRSGTEFGGAQIVKKEKTTPAPVFDPNDTSEGIPQPPTAAGPLPVRASRVKRVATITTGYIQD